MNWRPLTLGLYFMALWYQSSMINEFHLLSHQTCFVFVLFFLLLFFLSSVLLYYNFSPVESLDDMHPPSHLLQGNKKETALCLCLYKMSP